MSPVIHFGQTAKLTSGQDFMRKLRTYSWGIYE